MEHMTWDPAFSVADPLIDEQHQALFRLINRMIDHPQAEYTSEVISELLTEATKYAVEHFRTEEEYMERLKYPSLAVHKLEHKKFLIKITNATMLVMEKKQGPTDLLAFLKAWFKHHILFSDMNYRRWNESRFEKPQKTQDASCCTPSPEEAA
ncbi:MAG: bacteriohemerythrin [Acidobacteriota bacterium]